MTEPQIKKHLTAEEHAMRRAEMARRRKNLSEKRNEEEKVTRIFFPINPYFFLSFSSFHHHTRYPNISPFIHPLSPTPTNPPIPLPQFSTFSLLSPFPSIHSPP